MAASEKRPMFLVNCIATFLPRTRPASNIEKPAAIQKTKKPAIKNSNEFRMNTVSVEAATFTGASCANVSVGKAARTAPPTRDFISFIFVSPFVAIKGRLRLFRRCARALLDLRPAQILCRHRFCRSALS